MKIKKVFLFLPLLFLIQLNSVVVFGATARVAYLDPGDPISGEVDFDTICSGTEMILDLSACTYTDSIIVDWGDGTLPNKIYTHPASLRHIMLGGATISITAYDGPISDIDSRRLEVLSTPNASFSHNYTSKTCIKEGGILVSFDDNSNFFGAPPPYTYNWSFGDFTTSNEEAPVHNYSISGTFTITLQVAISIGSWSCGSNSYNSEIEITELPSLLTDVIIAEGCPCNKSSINILGGATSWMLSFGDADTAYVGTATHTYASPGTYVVSAMGKDANGCIHKKKQTISICTDDGLPKSKSNNRWYFGGATTTSCISNGEEAGINFNSNPPTALTDGKIASIEGAATMSDANSGELLFYTNGIVVWDKNHNSMPGSNAMLGDCSSTQGALIVPNPASKDKYYIFTSNGSTGGHKGYYYSEVDLSMRGGLGDIISSTKNTPLFNGPCLESLNPFQPTYKVSHEALSGTVKQIANCQKDAEYWVVIPSCMGTYNAYKITTAGIEAPIVSVFPSDTYNSSGASVFSSDGKKYAIVERTGLSGSISKTRIFDFDLVSGQLSNVQDISSSYYGIEFSPNNRFLYVVENSNRLYQFDLNEPDPNKSKIQIGTSVNMFSMVLGIDTKIYVANPGFSTLAVINKPDSLGLSCDFQANGFSLGLKKSRYGLQNIVPLAPAKVWPDTFSIDFAVDSVNCATKTVYFGNPTCKFIPDSIRTTWDFGDGTKQTFLTLEYPSHAYLQNGVYSVSMILSKSCYRNDTIKRNIVVDVPVFDLGHDTTLCEGEALLLNIDVTPASFLWQDGSTKSSFEVSAPDTYSVQVSNSCGTVMDMVTINYNPAPTVSLIEDTLICDGTTIMLNASATGAASYLWQDASTNTFFNVTETGRHKVVVTNEFDCSDSDSVLVTYGTPPEIYLGNDTVVCSGQTRFLAPTCIECSYLWQDGSTASSYNAIATGQYRLFATNSCGEDRDTINMTIVTPPSLNLGNDTMLCENELLLLSAGTAEENNYLWQDGSTNKSLTAFVPGTYWASVRSAIDCSTRDSIRIDFCENKIFVPTTFTPNGDGINDVFLPHFLESTEIENFELKIFDRWGALAFSTRDYAFGWDGKKSNMLAPEDVYVVWITYNNHSRLVYRLLLLC